MTDSQEKEYYIQLGQQFKKLRKRVGKTIEEVADSIGVKVALIAQFENNGKKISAYRLNQLMQVFGFKTIEETILEANKEDEELKKKSLETRSIKQHLQLLLRAVEEAVKELNEETKIEIPDFLRAPAARQNNQQESQQERQLNHARRESCE